MADLAQLTAEDFTAHAGEPFTLPDGTVYVLADVAVLPVHGEAPRAPFTLTFAGPAGVVRPQGIQSLTNDTLGTLELFLVPVSQDAAGVRYEAVFG